MILRLARFLLKTLALVALLVLFLAAAVQISTQIHRFMLPPAERLLADADNLANISNWRAAEPLYKTAKDMFHQQGNGPQELYAKVSQIPAHAESATTSISEWLAEVEEALKQPAARNPRTRLRILEIEGQIENNYDATLAYRTWSTVEQLAAEQHNWTLENRAYGEEAIGLFLLGDIGGARRHAFFGHKKTYLLGDRYGRMRLAALIGAGMVQFNAYESALTYLNQAISIAASTPNAAYPSVAVTAKIDALRGLKRYREALTLSAEAMRVPEREHLRGHLYQILETRAPIWQDMGIIPQATRDYAQAFQYAKELGYWRGLTESGGPLAQAYERQNQLTEALSTIDEALNAQHRIPSEMYFAPRNLAIKAEIQRKLGKIASSNDLYERSLALVDSLLVTAPTPTIVDRILDDYAGVYSGYFASLCAQNNLPAAFAVIERAHGRLEVEALQSHKHLLPHEPTPQEQALTALNLKLISTDDQARRVELLSQVGTVEDQLDLDPWGQAVATRPVPVEELQRELQPEEVVIEYVLANPVSFALAITANSITPYPLASRSEIAAEMKRYVSLLSKQQADIRLAGTLFQHLLGPIAEFKTHNSAIIIPDSDIHLLPFAALHDGSHYVVETHTTSVVPAATVLHMLRVRSRNTRCAKPFLGFAPWAEETETPHTSVLASFLGPLRGSEGPKKSDFIPLPESKREVFTGRNEIDRLEGVMPTDDQIKIGAKATESEFKRLPLEQYQVVHLAVHGYADIEHPDRSALIFAHDPNEKSDDGLLQIREIRRLHLNSALVILSACKTGIGPAGEAGVANISNAFLQAGAHTVVASFWPVADHATSEIMERFYTQLASNESKADAMQKAALGMLQSGLPPYYWASFQISGDPDGTLAVKK